MTEEALTDERAVEARERSELPATLLLALATILTAWCAYQATHWSGVQADLDLEASETRLVAAQAMTLFAAAVQIDAAVWLAWLERTHAGDEGGAEAMEARFRDEFRPAFEAWSALAEAEALAPDTPFDLEEYAPSDEATVLALNERAEEAAAEARWASRLSDDFVLTTVVMAGVLFFAAVGTKLRSPRLPAIMLAIGTFLFLAGLLFTLSIHLRPAPA